jgi:hypothetical protein
MKLQNEQVIGSAVSPAVHRRLTFKEASKKVLKDQCATRQTKARDFQMIVDQYVAQTKAQQQSGSSGTSPGRGQSQQFFSSSLSPIGGGYITLQSPRQKKQFYGGGESMPGQFRIIG